MSRKIFGSLKKINFLKIFLRKKYIMETVLNDKTNISEKISCNLSNTFSKKFSMLSLKNKKCPVDVKKIYIMDTDGDHPIRKYRIKSVRHDKILDKYVVNIECMPYYIIDKIYKNGWCKTILLDSDTKKWCIGTILEDVLNNFEDNNIIDILNSLDKAENEYPEDIENYHYLLQK